MLRASSVASRRTSESLSFNSGAMNGAMASGNACKRFDRRSTNTGVLRPKIGQYDLDAGRIADAHQRRHDGFAHARHRLAAKGRGKRRHCVSLAASARAAVQRLSASGLSSRGLVRSRSLAACPALACL